MKLRTGLIIGSTLVTSVAMTASAATLADLGSRVGWTSPLHWALPVAVDVLALVAGVAWLASGVSPAARKLGRTLTLVSVVVSVALNAISHLVSTRYMTPGPWLVIAVSAVPPLAAALAVHLTAAITTPDPAKVGTAAEVVRDAAPSPVPARVSPTPPKPVPVKASPLVICGGHLEIPAVPPRPKLGTTEAREAIERAWRDGLSVREAARVSTRSPSQVQRVYTRLEIERGAQQVPGQIALEGVAA